MLWLTKQLHAKIAEQNLFLLKVSRNFTKKRDLTTNRKDALNAEEQENNNEITEAMVTDINNNFILSKKSGFLVHFYYFIKNL